MHYITQLDKDMEDAITEHYDYSTAINAGASIETTR
jgi:hypothetical protein